MAIRTKELLEGIDGATLTPHVLLALARVFGTHHSRKGAWSFGPDSDPWVALDNAKLLSSEALASEFWADQLQPVIASRLQYCGPKDARRLHQEFQASLALISSSYQDLYRAAAIAIPEPKAWLKLPGYEPEDLDAPLPDTAFGPLPDFPEVPFPLDDPDSLLHDAA